MGVRKAASLFPSKLPECWMAGFVHHHTAFRYPSRHRVSPAELRQEVAELGGDFVFCAGDHGGEVDGEFCPGWHTGEDYYVTTLEANEGDGVLLLPTGEYHLWFPDLTPRDPDASFWKTRRKYPTYQPFHHALIPMVEWQEAACRHVEAHASAALPETAQALGIAPTLNHPGLCYLTGHPDPLSIPWLKRMPYLEIFDTMDYFDYDWAIRKHYLGCPESRSIGISAGVDFASHKGLRFATPGNERAEHITYIQVPGGRSLKHLHDAWLQRRTVAVRGRLFLEHITPIPRLEAYEATTEPEIAFTVQNFGGKQIQKVEILRDGVIVHREFFRDRETLEFFWCDKSFEGPEARYTIHIEGEGDHLITSPIGFVSR